MRRGPFLILVLLVLIMSACDSNTEPPTLAKAKVSPNAPGVWNITENGRTFFFQVDDTDTNSGYIADGNNPQNSFDVTCDTAKFHTISQNGEQWGKLFQEKCHDEWVVVILQQGMIVAAYITDQDSFSIADPFNATFTDGQFRNLNNGFSITY